MSVIDREKLKLNAKYDSISSITPFTCETSATRLLMLGSQIGAAIDITNGGDPLIIKTGTDREIAKYSYDIKIKKDCMVQAIIHNRSEEEDDYDTIERWIFVRGIDSKYDIYYIPTDNKLNNTFGFSYNLTSLGQTLKIGQSLSAGDVLARSPSISEEGDYQLGKNLNVAFIPLSENSEDSLIISSRLTNETTTVFGRRKALVSATDLMVNAYGSEEVYKPFPEVGDTVREDGLLFAVRRLSDKIFPALASTKSLLNVDPITDMPTYIRTNYGKSVVTDIKVYVNDNSYNFKALENTSEEINRLNRRQVNAYKKILEAYDFATKGLTEREKSGILTPELINLIQTARLNLYSYNKDKAHKINKIIANEDIQLYVIEITTKTEVPIGVGFKLSNFYGGKVVSSAIWPEEDMPVDEYGNRADVIIDPNTIGSRMNPSTLYEHYITGVSRALRRKIREIVPTIQDVYKLSPPELENILEKYYYPVYESIDKRYSDILKNASLEAKQNKVAYTVAKEYTYFYKGDGIRPSRLLKDKWEKMGLKPDTSKLKYKYNGVDTVTEFDAFIAPIHMFLINKISNNYLASSSLTLNQLNMPITGSGKHALPYKDASSRAALSDESSVKGIAAYNSPELLLRFKMLYSSPIRNRHHYRNLLTADKPSAIEDTFDNLEPNLKDDSIRATIYNLFKSAGFEINIDGEEFKEVPDGVQAPNDITDSEIDSLMPTFNLADLMEEEIVIGEEAGYNNGIINLDPDNTFN